MNHPFRRAFGALCLSAFAVGFASAAAAQVVVDRSTLLALLGPSAVTEGFEAYNVADGQASMLGVTTLDASTTANGQGPGLVIPGFSLSTTTYVLQWNGPGYYGLPSKTVVAGGAPGVIDFAPAVAAFGVDFLEFTGYPDTTAVTVYGPDRATVLYTSAPIPVTGPAPVFFGYQAAGGIGRVRFTSTSWAFPPIVDNLTFGVNVAPTITAIAPPSGPVAGGIPVTITGTNLASPTSVTFGGAAATVTGSTATSITVTLPPHAFGWVDVVVTTAGGSATLAAGLLYLEPSVVPTLSGGMLALLAAALAAAGALKLRG